MIALYRYAYKIVIDKLAKIPESITNIDFINYHFNSIVMRFIGDSARPGHMLIKPTQNNNDLSLKSFF